MIANTGLKTKLFLMPIHTLFGATRSGKSYFLTIKAVNILNVYRKNIPSRVRTQIIQSNLAV